MGIPIALVVAIAVPEILGSIVGQSTRENLLNWFATLRKPSWEPPGPLFGIAWTILYAVMGWASWRVWLVGGWQANQRTLTLYVIQLALNLSWPLVFFNAKKLGTALALNLGVLATAAATASAFYKVDHLAGQLMLPYLAWLAFANALNYSVWQKNPQATSNVEDLSTGASKRNPGEKGYSGTRPTTAMLSSTATGGRSRASTVRVACSFASAKPAAKPMKLVKPVMLAVRPHAGCAIRPASSAVPCSVRF